MTAQLQPKPFRAMGTLCMVATHANRSAQPALDAACTEVAACERALSRFDPDSDLSRLNLAPGQWIHVDERLMEALAAALHARAETDGRFDPTILPALAAAGYDRSFELLTAREPTPIGTWRAGARIDLDPWQGRARIERGTAVDLGGIGKGFGAGRALRALRAAWPEAPGALVDLGGDIEVFGTPPGGGPWRIDIADPRTSGLVAGTLQIDRGGVATSGRDTRRFGPGGRLHHLIDPETGLPAAAGPLAVTVVAPTAAEAEVYATALAIAGPDEARAQIATRQDVSALLIRRDGDPIEIGRLPLIRERASARIVITTPSGRIPWH